MNVITDTISYTMINLLERAELGGGGREREGMRGRSGERE